PEVVDVRPGHGPVGRPKQSVEEGKDRVAVGGIDLYRPLTVRGGQSASAAAPYQQANTARSRHGPPTSSSTAAAAIPNGAKVSFKPIASPVRRPARVRGQRAARGSSWRRRYAPTRQSTAAKMRLLRALSLNVVPSSTRETGSYAPA